VKQATFSLDPLEGQTFEGFTEGERWNDWACPYFTKAQAEQIVTARNKSGYKADYDPAADVFRFAPIDQFGKSNPDLGDEEDAEHFPAVTRDGQTLYPVGAWAWEEVLRKEASFV